ncbi:hypothetical protein PVL29_003924 [Vitis rotundifolia]|uniref:Core-2/I-branching beta-1,6-N-acetylglucosaminyltransferase family protein n=1 Tax=Vitis rotundifolia TaxID=103349 RepID=A0AA39DZN5_VITRO|nr:hypothetical protein PVL29_003924 [Vitis rotundifolia]
MQSRALSTEEGKDPANTSRTNQSRVLPLRLLQIFGLFLALCVAFSVISVYMIKRFGVSTTLTSPQSSFQPCYEEVGGLDRWIKPPSTLLHTMNDTELFWRASFSPKMKQYPFQRVPKVAFMFLTKGPLPLGPLWERFLKGHEGLYSIYIHSTPSFRANFPASSVFYRRQIPSKVAEWGKMSMCDAERRLLANALLDISNERFMGAFDDPGPHGRGRYNWNMKPEVSISQWRKGAQWFEVNRKLAVNIVEDTTFYKKFEEFCKPACYVDEHYFPTMLTIQSGNLIANRSLTWVDWSRGGAHPATFGKADITEEFLHRAVSNHKCLYNNQPSSTCFLFARKFAPSTLEPLLQLAHKHLGF